MEHLGAVSDVAASITRQHGRGHQQPVGKDGVGVSLPVTVTVFKNGDGVVGDLTRLDLRVNARRRHPEPPLRVKVHLQRLANHRIGRKQVHFIPLCHQHVRQFSGRIRSGNVGEFSLGGCRVSGHC